MKQHNEIKQNMIVGIVFILLGIALGIMTMDIDMPANLYEPGPRVFPYLCSAGLIICGIGVIAERHSEQDEDNAGAIAVFFDREQRNRFIKLAVVLIVYAAAIWLLGFLVPSIVIMYVLIRLLSAKKVSVVRSVLVAVITAGIIWLIFRYGLSTILPRGILFK